jgi:hypothetical protein
VSDQDDPNLKQARQGIIDGAKADGEPVEIKPVPPK